MTGRPDAPLPPAWPDRAAWGTAPSLRAWQQSAVDDYRARQPRDFLTVATPGAGKTTFALTVAADLLSRRVVDRITVVAPTEHLKTQWAEAAARVADLPPAPRDATTEGTGVVARAVLDSGVEEVLVCLGGSATTDGGTGILTTLGVRFLDGGGRVLGLVRGLGCAIRAGLGRGSGLVVRPLVVALEEPGRER